VEAESVQTASKGRLALLVMSSQAAADAIIASTDLSLLAWDCKLAAAAQRADLPAMVEAKYHYLLLSRYRGEVYLDFVSLLENACALLWFSNLGGCRMQIQKVQCLLPVRWRWCTLIH